MLINVYSGIPYLAKLVFVLADLGTGYLILVILRKTNRMLDMEGLLVGMWLFNPFVVGISSRGSYESIISMCVLGVILLER
jgi:phosphatidylinositol glycan class M